MISIFIIHATEQFEIKRNTLGDYNPFLERIIYRYIFKLFQCVDSFMPKLFLREGSLV